MTLPRDPCGPPVESNAARFSAVPLTEPGTPAEGWEAVAQKLPTLTVPGIRRALVVVAHPDDEVLGPGLLVAQLASRGVAVEVLIATAGERSHEHEPAVNPAELAGLRRNESRRAADVLGTGEPCFLDLPDGAVEEHEALIRDAVRDRLGAADAAVPLTVLTHWRGDGHPDHEAVGRAVLAAVCSAARGEGAGRPETLEVLEFPLWALHWDRPDGGRLLTSAAYAAPAAPLGRRAKADAAACFTSQVRPWPEGAAAPVMPEHVVTRLLQVPELYLRSAFPGGVEGIDHLMSLYAADDDPWDMESSLYEAQKRRATLAALPRPRYRLAFEPGCSIGVLTCHLAQRAEQVIGWEAVPRAAASARERVRGLEESGTLPPGRVHVEGRMLSSQPGSQREATLGPQGADLVVISELLYFLPREELADIISGLCERAAHDAHLVAVHWRHPVGGWPEGAAASHEALWAEPALDHLYRDDTCADYLIDVFQVRRHNGQAPTAYSGGREAVPAATGEVEEAHGA